MSGFQVAGSAYDRFMGRYSGALAERFSNAAGIRQGVQALDVGCGPGALTAVLAARLGAEAVAAVDPSVPFVEACRRRVPGADVRLAGAEALPFDSGTFDAVLAQLVVNFIPDPPAGVAEMCRVARTGAVVGAAVWDYGGGMTMLRAFWDAAADVCGPAAVEADEGRRMRYCDPESLGGLWRDAGLAEVSVQALDVEAGYADFDDLWWPFTQGVGPAGAFVVALDPPDRDRVRHALRERLGSPPGPFTLAARAWCALGQKSSSAPA